MKGSDEAVILLCKEVFEKAGVQESRGRADSLNSKGGSLREAISTTSRSVAVNKREARQERQPVIAFDQTGLELGKGGCIRHSPSWGEPQRLNP